MADQHSPVSKIVKKVTKPGRSAAIGFIFVTIFIDVLGLGIIIPVLPKLLQVLGHINVNRASEYIGWLTFVYASMQLIFASIMGIFFQFPL